MKTGKFIPLGYYENVKIGYGTVDYKNLKTIYLKLNSWVQPQTEDYNYEQVLAKTRRSIKNKIYLLIYSKLSHYKCYFVCIAITIS